MPATLAILLVLGWGAGWAVPAAAVAVGAPVFPPTVRVAGTHTATRAVVSASSCDMPSLENRAVIVNGDVEVTIASERVAYKAGETIQIYILYKNLGPDTLRIERPNTPMHGISVLPETCKSSRQAGCDALLLFQIPTIVFPAFDSMVLLPGECGSWSDPWNGRSTADEQLLGRFTVLGGIWERPLVLFLHDYSLPQGGAPLGIEIGEVGVEGATWGRVRSLFR